MPTAFSFVVRNEGLSPAADDLQRLACWMLEGPRAATHHHQDKAFSAWPVLPSAETGAAELRINWLPDDDREARERVAAGISRGMRLGETPVGLLGVRVRRVTFAGLARSPASWDITYRFLSPTYFSRSGRDYLLPDPALICADLVSRWNQAVGEPDQRVSETQYRGLGSRNVMKRHELRTERFA